MTYMKGLSVFKKGDTTTIIVNRNNEPLSLRLTF